MDQQLRNAYYTLTIGDKNQKEEVWIKKLNVILNADIHKNPLGCKISNTHMKIGQVHLESFFEAQILFSHMRWVNRFSQWLYETIHNETQNNVDNIIIIGYETYIEPVLFSLQKKFIDHSVPKINLLYGIYEEPKYMQSTGNRVTEAKIRYLEDILASIKNNPLNFSRTKVIYLCGISSTLSTFKKISSFFQQKLSEIENSQNIKIDKKELFYSVIQVLPENETQKINHPQEGHKRGFSSNVNNGICWYPAKKTVYTLDQTIKVKYLTSVFCVWHNSDTCPLCFPKDPYMERPIIETSETSVVPIQMITALSKRKNEPKETNSVPSKINLFSKDKNKYKYLQYLYYSHIERADDHYKYYIRTGHLFRDIINDPSDFKIFKDFCAQIREKLLAKSQHTIPTIDIIISPSHFSDELFPSAINQYVFDNTAHLITFDPKKEFRSNFETKHSNFSYFLEQTKQTSNEQIPIRFFYIDDQLVSGSSFYRAKSLVTSLMGSSSQTATNQTSIFEAVIVLLSRCSKHTKHDYISDPSYFFSLIDISIPSIRNYGDSCPICKMRQNAFEYAKNSALDCSELYWTKKHYDYRVKTLDEVKSEKLQSKHETLNYYHFLRFYCENTLWEYTKNSFSEEDYLSSIATVIQNIIKGKKNQCNYLISIIKAISKPFLYYKENEKKAALKILISIMEEIRHSNITLNRRTRFVLRQKPLISFSITFHNLDEIYSLLVIIINCLSTMDSTYMLDLNRILDFCKVVNSWSPQLLMFTKYETLTDSYKESRDDLFFSVLLNSFKRITCGISGESKSRKIDPELKKWMSLLKINSSQEKIVIPLFATMFLENIKSCTDINLAEAIIQAKSSTNVLKKFEELSKRIECCLKNHYKVAFFYYDSSFNTNIFKLCEDVDALKYAEVIDTEMTSQIATLGYCFKQDTVIVKLQHYYESDIPIESIMNQKEDRILPKGVYLQICPFSNTAKDSLPLLESVRSILKHRYELSKIIRADLDSNAIKEAIQAKAGRDLLLSDKNLSHGADRDTTSLINNVVIKAIDTDPTNWLSISNKINLLMNRCISYSYTHSTLLNYFSQYEISAPENKKDVRESPFANDVQLCNSWENGLTYFKTYLSNICNRANEYFNTSTGDIPIITITPSVDHFVKALHNNVPSFFNSGSLDAKKSIICLAGLIDVLLRNAITHGDLSSAIEISIKAPQNYVAPFKYTISISNKRKALENHNSGITLQFFEDLNNRRNSEYDSNGFIIKIDQKPNRYSAEITVEKNFISTDE